MRRDTENSVVRLIENGRWAHKTGERERKEMKKYRSILEIETEYTRVLWGAASL
jgi:hypothetical protein